MTGLQGHYHVDLLVGADHRYVRGLSLAAAVAAAAAVGERLSRLFAVPFAAARP